MNYTLIVAVDKNFGIGFNGDMLFYIKKDLKRFKDITTDNIIVMGRRTFEALPDSKELPNRINVVLSRKEIKIENGKSVKSLEELESYLKEINPNNEKEVFLIGGGKLINTLWNKIDKANITIAEKTFEDVDTHIPNILEDKNFEIENISEEFYDEENKINFKYYEFKKRVAH